MGRSRLTPPSQSWLDSVVEDVVDPDDPIIDPHHHLWPDDRGLLPYDLDDLLADLTSGHNVVDTVFVECGAAYRDDGAEYLAPIGESEYVAREAERSTRRAMSGIVGRADLTDVEHLGEVLDAHEAAAGGRFRGIRHALARAVHPEAMRIPGRAAAGLSSDTAFRAGMAQLGERGLTYDTWHYHHQNQDFVSLARAVPETTMVLDHVGTPVGVGPYESLREEIFEQWTRDIEDLAACPNVVAKLGGLAMPDNGFGWDRAQRPPTSDEVVASQRRYYLHVIEQFGPDRCMFESNFPVDRLSMPYRTFWNAAKKMIAHFSQGERDAMLRGTAARVYRLDG